MSDLKRTLKDGCAAIDPARPQLVRVAGKCPGTQYEFLVTAPSEDQMGIMREFLPVERVVKNVDDLCDQLATKLTSQATLAFDNHNGLFFIYVVVPKAQVGLYLDRMAEDCDTLEPLCRSIGREGWWSEQVIELAYQSPETMHRFKQ